MDEHAPVITRLAIGLREVRSKPIVGRSLDMDRFLDDMLQSRIARRMLAENHIAFHRLLAGDDVDEDFVGVVNTRLDVRSAINAAARQAHDACAAALGEAPRIDVSCSDGLKMAYVPTHVHYVLFEVLKNSCRATVEQARAELDPKAQLDPVEVRVRADTVHNATNILVTDQGTGLSDSDVTRAFTYGWTTAGTPNPNDSALDAIGGGGAAGTAALMSGEDTPLAGLGFGLPLSRLHCRYFGGDLRLVPVGVGCGAVTLVRFQNLAADSPLYKTL